MPKTKIQDMEEARHLLIDQGLTLDEMVTYYRDHYGIETSKSMWSRTYKRLTGTTRQLDPYSISTKYCPWEVKANYGGAQYLAALEVLDRIDKSRDVEGVPRIPLDDELRSAINNVLETIRVDLMISNTVITYDAGANTFTAVPRREGIDTDWIRNPFLDDNGRPTDALTLGVTVRPEAMLEYIEESGGAEEHLLMALEPPTGDWKLSKAWREREYKEGRLPSDYYERRKRAEGRGLPKPEQEA
ncbi:hypothetical protein [Actinomyces culturomici]|uniref:hypothetical protein n=1 Tax=Actinomyces culturomici TaxID=1926276 RepID=UPI00135A22CF|nr:hypothetical protein [Actinomyces culturomici]